MKRLSCIVLCGMVILMMGCGQKVPDGFPAVHPCTITVNKGGSPLEGASVTLHAEVQGNAYAVGGATDASGVAKIATTQGSFQKPGAPAGNYKVTVMKAAEIPGKLPDSEVEKMEQGERQAYMVKLTENQSKAAKVVPEKLTNPTSTTLSITVAESGGTLEVDVDTQ